MPQSRGTWNSITLPRKRNLTIAKCRTAKYHHHRDFPSSVLSYLGCVCYLFHLLKTKNSQSVSSQGASVRSTWTINKIFAGCNSLAATSGKAAASGPCFPHQLRSFWSWFLWCFIPSEVISTIFSNTSYEEKGKRWECRERPKVIENYLPFWKRFFPLKNLSHKCVPLDDAITPLLFWK